MPARDRERQILGDDRLFDLLEREGFIFGGTHREAGAEVATWDCSPPETSRHVHFRVHVHVSADRSYSIDVEEWRGGEGYEDEEFRSEQASESVVAIERWAAWAREPFVCTRGATAPPRAAIALSWWGRFRRSLGLP